MEINNNNNIPTNTGSNPLPKLDQNAREVSGEAEIGQVQKREDAVRIEANAAQKAESVPSSYSQFKDVYAVSDTVFSLFQINGKQFTRERSLETGEVTYFPKVDEVSLNGYDNQVAATRTDFDKTV